VFRNTIGSVGFGKKPVIAQFEINIFEYDEAYCYTQCKAKNVNERECFVTRKIPECDLQIIADHTPVVLKFATNGVPTL